MQIDSREFSELLQKHAHLSSELSRIKDEEMKLRIQICDVLLDGKASGTHKFNIGSFVVKVVKSYNYSLDQDLVHECIERGEFSDDEMAAIRTKYELGLAAYKKLEECPILDDCITVKDATPTLKIEEI